MASVSAPCLARHNPGSLTLSTQKRHYQLNDTLHLILLMRLIRYTYDQVPDAGPGEHMKNEIDGCRHLTQFLAKAKTEGLRFLTDGTQLHYNGPQSLITQQFLNYVRLHKTELITLLIENGGARSIQLAPINVMKMPHRGLVPLHIQRHWKYATTRKSGVPVLAKAAQFDHNPATIPAIERSFAALLSRHDILHSRLTDVSGQGTISFGGAGEPDITTIPDTSTQLHGSISNAIPERFDPSTDPLFRSLLLPLDNGKVVFVILGNHVTMDEISMQILLDEFCQLYRSYVTLSPSGLLKPDVQYADYAQCIDRLPRCVLEKHANVWRTLLRGATVTRLPLDFATTESEYGPVDFCSFDIEDQYISRLRAEASKCKVTLFTILLAAHNVALFRTAGLTETTVGVLHSGRDIPILQRMVGCFATKYYSTTHINQDKYFSDIIMDIWDGNILHCQNLLPLDVIADEINVADCVKVTPTFNFIPSPHTTRLVQNRLYKPYTVRLQARKLSRLPAHHITVNGTDHLRGVIQFRSDLYKKRTMQRFADQYSHVIKQIAVGSARSKIGQL